MFISRQCQFTSFSPICLFLFSWKLIWVKCILRRENITIPLLYIEYLKYRLELAIVTDNFSFITLSVAEDSSSFNPENWTKTSYLRKYVTKSDDICIKLVWWPTCASAYFHKNQFITVPTVLLAGIYSLWLPVYYKRMTPDWVVVTNETLFIDLLQTFT